MLDGVGGIWMNYDTFEIHEAITIKTFSLQRVVEGRRAVNSIQYLISIDFPATHTVWTLHWTLDINNWARRKRPDSKQSANVVQRDLWTSRQLESWISDRAVTRFIINWSNLHQTSCRPKIFTSWLAELHTILFGNFGIYLPTFLTHTESFRHISINFSWLLTKN